MMVPSNATSALVLIFRHKLQSSPTTSSTAWLSQLWEIGLLISLLTTFLRIEANSGQELKMKCKNFWPDGESGLKLAKSKMSKFFRAHFSKIYKPSSEKNQEWKQRRLRQKQARLCKRRSWWEMLLLRRQELKTIPRERFTKTSRPWKSNNKRQRCTSKSWKLRQRTTKLNWGTRWSKTEPDSKKIQRTWRSRLKRSHCRMSWTSSRLKKDRSTMQQSTRPKSWPRSTNWRWPTWRSNKTTPISRRNWRSSQPATPTTCSKPWSSRLPKGSTRSCQSRTSALPTLAGAQTPRIQQVNWLPKWQHHTKQSPNKCLINDI